MKQIQFLIKPASSLCNLRCRYCFYADIANNRSIRNMGMMKQETIDRLLEEAFAHIAPGGGIHFAFQGGEPALVGLSFYDYFTAQADKRKPSGIAVSYSIQTNGTQFDESWIPLLKKYDFLVGISIDGYKDLHNHYRVDAAGKDTWKTVSHTFQMLTQVAGRAGRAAEQGLAILQTYQPERYSIRAAVSGDYERFYRNGNLASRGNHKSR